MYGDASSSRNNVNERRTNDVMFESLEVVQPPSQRDYNNNRNTATNIIMNHQSKPPPTRCFVIGRYIAIGSVMAVGTICCPGNTILWEQTQQCQIVMILLTSLLPVISFWALQGSDPGYLTADIVSQLSLQNDDDGDNNIEENQEEVCCVHGTDDHRQQQLYEQTTELVVTRMMMTTDELYYYPKLCRKRCDICGFEPPLRSHHCKDCNKCVACFDHHCKFIGTCIGELNHCRFYTFVTIHLIAVWICTKIINSSSLGCTDLLLLALNNNDDNDDMPIAPTVQVCATKCFLYFLFAGVIMLWVIHSFFAVTNSTTFEWIKHGTHLEYLKNTHPTDLPMSQGYLKNIYIFFCQKDDICRRRYFQREERRRFQPIVWRPPKKPQTQAMVCRGQRL